MFFPLSGPAGELCAVSRPGTTGSTTGGTAPGLDLSGLDSAVRGLFSSGLASSTQKVYQSGARRYQQLCSAYKVPVPFPVSEHTLMYFVAYLHQDGLAPGTVKSYLSAVHHSHISLGFGDPCVGDMPRLEYVITGLKRLAGSISLRTPLPITSHILHQLKHGESCPTITMLPCCGQLRVCASLASCGQERWCVVLWRQF